MRTLAELKRAIKIGTKIKKVDCAHTRFKPETLGKIRMVDKVQKKRFHYGRELALLANSG